MSDSQKMDSSIPEISRLMEFTRELEASMELQSDVAPMPRMTEHDSDDELEYDEHMLDEYASSLLDEFSKSSGYTPFDAEHRPTLVGKIEASYDTTQESPEISSSHQRNIENTSDTSSKSRSFEDVDSIEHLVDILPDSIPVDNDDTILYSPSSPIPSQIFSSIIAGDFSFFPVAKLTRRISDLWYLPHVTSMPFLLAKNSSIYSICSVLEIVLRPDIPLTKIVAAVKKISAIEGLSFRQHSSSYSVLTLTDEVSKPSTPLTTTESHQDAIKYVFRETNMDVDMLVTDSSGVWNEVHCEVCLSSEIRQRVLLCSFVRNKSLNTPDALLQRHIINDEFGLTKHLISTLQLLTSNYMSFSCIYYPDIMPTMDVPPRIDDSTILLLLGFVHRTMILKFKAQRKDMYSYIDATEVKYNYLLSLVQPIYKQHGLAEPFPVSVPREIYLPGKGDTPQTTASELWEEIQHLLLDVLARHTADDIVNCLIAQMDTVWNFVNQKKDDELTKKLSMHNAYTVTVVNEYCQHRRRLLWDIIHSHRSKESKLAESYASVFNGYEAEDVVIPSPSKAPPPSSASFLAEGGKWLTTTLSNGLQSFLQPSSAPITKEEPKNILPRTISRQDSNTSTTSHDPASDVVLYCCTCLVGADPGFMYVTSNYISTASRHLATLSKRREVDSLKDLVAIEVVPHKSQISLPSTLILTFCDASDRKKVIRITPAWVDATKLKILIEDARDIVCNLPPGH